MLIESLYYIVEEMCRNRLQDCAAVKYIKIKIKLRNNVGFTSLTEFLFIKIRMSNLTMPRNQLMMHTLELSKNLAQQNALDNENEHNSWMNK